MSQDKVLPVIHVMAGALLDAQGRVLIAQRPPGKHMAGGWEFPGGKLDNGEAELDGLKRELREELAIEMIDATFIAGCSHDYPDRRVLLELWLVPRFSGEVQALDGQALRWIAPADLHEAGMLPADKPLIDALLAVLSERLSRAVS